MSHLLFKNILYCMFQGACQMKYVILTFSAQKGNT